MSVQTQLVLPAQPTTGQVKMITLGGDGKTAPQSMQLAQMETTGDASGGFHLQTFRLDDQFQSMLYLVGVSVTGASANVPVLIAYQVEDGPTLNGRIVHHGQLTYTDVGLTAGHDAGTTWRPPPAISSDIPYRGVLSAPYVQIYVPNGNGSVLRCTLWIYNFRRGARQHTPWPFLVGNFSQ